MNPQNASSDSNNNEPTTQETVVQSNDQPVEGIEAVQSTSKVSNTDTVNHPQIMVSEQSTETKAAQPPTLSPNPGKHTLWKIMAVLLVTILVIAAIGLVYASRSKPKLSVNQNNSSTNLQAQNNNPSTQTQDPKIEQDLASIGQAMGSLPYNNSGDPALALPSKLSKLNVTLNYSVNSYPYKILEDDGGEDNSTAIYEICANFNTNTFNVSTYNNSAGASNNPGTSSSSYALHSQGEQCFTNSITQEANGVDLVANNSESQYKGQINAVSNENWPTDSAFKTPVTLPENK